MIPGIKLVKNYRSRELGSFNFAARNDPGGNETGNEEAGNTAGSSTGASGKTVTSTADSAAGATALGNETGSTYYVNDPGTEEAGYAHSTDLGTEEAGNPVETGAYRAYGSAVGGTDLGTEAGNSVS